MRIPPKISALSVVARGTFNPLIFRPDWFHEKEILAGSDFENVNIEIIHPDIVSFGVPWGTMIVERDKFSLSSSQEPHIRAHDFFVRCFQNLPETPISAVGINVEIHFDAGSEAACDHVGDVLAPKAFWEDFVKKDGKKFGGLRSITMEQAAKIDGESTRQDGEKGWVHVQVEPSIRVKNGIYVRVNDHFKLLDGEKFSNGREAAQLVTRKWDASCRASESYVDKIMELALSA